jgi:hypothetical protein
MISNLGSLIPPPKKNYKLNIPEYLQVKRAREENTWAGGNE